DWSSDVCSSDLDINTITPMHAISRRMSASFVVTHTERLSDLLVFPGCAKHRTHHLGRQDNYGEGERRSSQTEATDTEEAALYERPFFCDSGGSGLLFVITVTYGWRAFPTSQRRGGATA